MRSSVSSGQDCAWAALVETAAAAIPAPPARNDRRFAIVFVFALSNMVFLL
jgi:hypothetical protein